VQVPGANTVEGPPPILPPLSTSRGPHPTRAGIGDALARGWKALGWKGKLLVVCSAYLAVNLLVVAFVGLDRQPKDEPVGDGHGTAAPQAGPQFRYTVTDLGTLGGETSEAHAINNRGQVVGRAWTGGDKAAHAFLWDSGRGMQDLGTLGGASSCAEAINDAEQVVGGSDIQCQDSLLNDHAFLWKAGGGMQDLGTLGTRLCSANAINRNGQVVGFGSTLDRSTREGADIHAFQWDAQHGMCDLAAHGVRNGWASGINDAGQVVGVTGRSAGPGAVAFLWEAGRGTRDLGTLGGQESWAFCINNAGQVVGLACTTGGKSHAFLWEVRSGMRDLGTLGREESAAFCINNAGQIVGGPPTGSRSTHPAFLYSDGKMTDLNAMIDPASGWHLTEAKAINDSGQIVGNGKNKAGQSHAFLLTPVPLSESAAVSSTAQSPTKPVAASKADASRKDEHLPTGWVRIVNRGTGMILHAGRDNQGPFRIERAGDGYKICQEPGQCLTLARWATRKEYASAPPQQRHEFFLHRSPESGSPYMLWEIRPLGNGFWSITNRATGRSLEIRKGTSVAWQSPLRAGALEQQWRFEEVSPPATVGDKEKPVQANVETRPATQTPAALPNATADKPSARSTPEPSTASESGHDVEAGGRNPEESNARPIAPGSTWPSIVLWGLSGVALLAVAWLLHKKLGASRRATLGAPPPLPEGFGPPPLPAALEARPVPLPLPAGHAMPPLPVAPLPEPLPCRQHPWPAAAGALTSLLPWLARFAKAFAYGLSALGRSGWPLIAYTARRWRQLDRKWRVWAACALLAVVLLPRLFTFTNGGGAQAPQGAPSQGDAAQLVARTEPAVVTICCPDGGGSGFVVDEMGVIVTNYHVVEGAAEATVVFPDKTRFVVNGFLACAPGKDLALLKISPAGRKLPTLRLAEVAPAKGEKVYAFGEPMGLSGSVSDGMVAAVRRSAELPGTQERGYDAGLELIQMTAPISPGNSGGPLVNARGEVVGVNTIGSVIIAQNVNFAVSAIHVRDLIQEGRLNIPRPLSDLPPRRAHRDD
jgi:probable HAF family extracellular repeat protein